MIKTIIFDYAGVLTSTKNHSLFAKKQHKRFGLTEDELMTKVYLNWENATVCKESELIYWNKLSKDLKIHPDELRNLTIETFPLDQRMLEIIGKIRDKYKIIMMSNQVETWLEKVIEEYALKDKFHYFVNSYHTNFRKPDEGIFKIALERSKSKASEALFIDDKLENINAAKKLGMKVILFENFEQFKSDFDKFVKVYD